MRIPYDREPSLITAVKILACLLNKGQIPNDICDNVRLKLSQPLMVVLCYQCHLKAAFGQFASSVAKLIKLATSKLHGGAEGNMCFLK